MNLLKISTDAKYSEMDETGDYPHYLSHKDEPVDFYRKYKDDDFRPIEGGKNLQNLFDDSDIKDYHWFNLARRFLSKY